LYEYVGGRALGLFDPYGLNACDPFRKCTGSWVRSICDMTDDSLCDTHCRALGRGPGYGGRCEVCLSGGNTEDVNRKCKCMLDPPNSPLTSVMVCCTTAEHNELTDAIEVCKARFSDRTFDCNPQLATPVGSPPSCEHYVVRESAILRCADARAAKNRCYTPLDLDHVKAELSWRNAADKCVAAYVKCHVRLQKLNNAKNDSSGVVILH
jgi:hypothetical protein